MESSLSMQELESHKLFGGEQKRYSHYSSTLQCDMVFSVYLPPQVTESDVPVLYWLSGLTCNDQNFVTKAGAQQYASQYGMAIVVPDTSPRGDHVADAESWDLGQGAGFYLNATQAPWAPHYRMYDYLVDELPSLIAEHWPIDHSRCAISGHSMGGHGALVLALRNPETFHSLSAFSPICAPTQCPWGQRALQQYLGEPSEEWKHYDSCDLIRTLGTDKSILVDQGDDDEFLSLQLRPDLLQEACERSGATLNLRLQPGYDHSYFFIATFIGSHFAHHAKNLGLV